MALSKTQRAVLRTVAEAPVAERQLYDASPPDAAVGGAVTRLLTLGYAEMRDGHRVVAITDLGRRRVARTRTRHREES